MSLGERFLYIILYAICYSVAEVVLWAVVIFQLLNVLVINDKNQQLLKLGHELALYIYQIVQFMTFNQDERPFPIGEWPVDDQKL